MIARIGYASIAVALVALAGTFAVRVYRARQQALPLVEAPPEVTGRSCAEGIDAGRQLTKAMAFDRARSVYLWLLGHCDTSPVLPDAMLEAASLFGNLLQQPSEAQRVYREFLRRFPTHSEAGDAMYHLARLEIDAGNYAAAVAHLTTLAQRYPNSWHEESAKFLATQAAKMLTAERRKRRTVIGQLAELVPNNLVSLLALVTALGPTVIQAVSKAHGGTAPGRPRSRWAMPSVIVGLTLLNFLINNIDSARRIRVLTEKLDRLTAVATQSRESQ